MANRGRQAIEWAKPDNRLFTLDVYLIDGPITDEFARKNKVVCRTIQIRADQTLEELHYAIFKAFDREDQHMYNFEVGGKRPRDPKARRYVLPGEAYLAEPGREPAGVVTRTRIGDIRLKVDDAFGYCFDFGDDWWHQINVAAIDETAPKKKFPKVIKRVGQSPPQYADWDEEEEMSANMDRPPGIASPTIAQAFEEFLADQGKRLKPKTLSDYKCVIELLEDYINGYGYQGLLEEDEALYEKHHNAAGDECLEFCRIFGPEKIFDELGGFLGFFMIRKVIGSADLKRKAGTVTKKLSKWLEEKAYVSQEHALEGYEKGAVAVRDLPKAEKAADILFAVADFFHVDPNELDDEDYLDFDHYAIEKIEPGKLWLEVWDEDGSRTLGPVPVPKKATELLQPGWNISCALGRIKGQWRIIEAANVYP